MGPFSGSSGPRGGQGVPSINKCFLAKSRGSLVLVSIEKVSRDTGASQEYFGGFGLAREFGGRRPYFLQKLEGWFPYRRGIHPGDRRKIRFLKRGCRYWFPLS